MTLKANGEVTGSVERTERWRILGQRGATVWLTGLPAAGKTTIASALERHLLANQRLAYRLDGDVLRTGLTRDLGFDAASRNESVRRVGEVATILADAGVIVIVALVSPYAPARAEARTLHQAAGLRFVEAWVDTSLAECERRDPKGLYSKARHGELHGMTGVDAPYEQPSSPDIRVDGTQDPAVSAATILELLLRG